MTNRYIFDVDGTITPSRGQVDTDFAVFFSDFCANNSVYLVTGSDKEKTIEQIGEEIYSLAERVYNCSGSDVWQGEKHIRTDKWHIGPITRSFLVRQLEESKFPLRTGLHIEERPGMVNFSIVGRHATLGERKLYVEWDENNLERKHIAAQFNFRFPKLKAVIGGETGMDIFPKGYDKSQIIGDFDPTDTLNFFGDAMGPTGNDYPLKKSIIDNDLGFAIEVSGWKDTWSKLKCI